MAHILSTGGGKALLDAADVAVLLLDHQSGLLQTVQDIGIGELRANVASLARVATLMGLPVITTASVPDGPNGPLIKEVEELAPHAVYVSRKGEISAWDNEDFVRAVEATGKKTLVIAGIWTSVCVMLPALDALAAGYKVYAVIDASGDPSPMASAVTVARFAQAGVVPTSINAMVCELQRTWARPDAARYAEIYAVFSPHYAAAMESFARAQEAARK